MCGFGKVVAPNDPADDHMRIAIWCDRTRRFHPQAEIDCLAMQDHDAKRGDVLRGDLNRCALDYVQFDKALTSGVFGIAQMD